MSGAKRLLDQYEDCRSAAAAIAVRADLLKRCEYCGDLKDPQSYDFETAYRLGNSLISHADPLVEPFGGDRREMTDRVKEIGETTSDVCHCEYVFAKD